jgi:hypothetical protein
MIDIPLDGNNDKEDTKKEDKGNQSENRKETLFYVAAELLDPSNNDKQMYECKRKVAINLDNWNKVNWIKLTSK